MSRGNESIQRVGAAPCPIRMLLLDQPVYRMRNLGRCRIGFLVESASNRKKGPLFILHKRVTPLTLLLLQVPYVRLLQTCQNPDFE